MDSLTLLLYREYIKPLNRPSLTSSSALEPGYVKDGNAFFNISAFVVFGAFPRVVS